MNSQNETLKILYDNEKTNRKLRSGWGFSAFIQWGDRQILFDAGADINILKHNMEKMDVDPETVEELVLSHPHCDHTGGVSAVLTDDSRCIIHIPQGFPRATLETFESYDSSQVQIHKQMEVLSEGIWTTGSLTSNYRNRNMAEQSLVLRTADGPVLVTGCAHPGIEKIVNKVADQFQEQVHLALGGFHLENCSREEILVLIDNLKNRVRRICPTHCSGKQAVTMFEKHYGADFIRGGVGRELNL
ncbi:MAG: MBL fold metallo-hydrolase [Candidatus Acetothermia bacterium]